VRAVQIRLIGSVRGAQKKDRAGIQVETELEPELEPYRLIASF
jgi:hypothetical protein